MKDEIKEILDKLEIVARKHTIEVCEDGSKIETMPANVVDELRLNNYSSKLLLDYITNLQERLEVSQTNEETYRLEMEDITKCLGLAKDKIFDEVKEYATNLQEENQRLLKNLDFMIDKNDEKQKVIDEAIDKIYKAMKESDITGNGTLNLNELLDILKLKGENND